MLTGCVSVCSVNSNSSRLPLLPWNPVFTAWRCSVDNESLNIGYKQKRWAKSWLEKLFTRGSYCWPLFIWCKNTNHNWYIKHVPTVSPPACSCPLFHATMAGRVQLSEADTRWEGVEGKAVTVIVKRKENTHCASCPAPVTKETTTNGKGGTG